MTYRGIVKNGVVVLGETAELPEGTEVCVETIARGESFPSEGPTLVEQFRDVIGTVPELPSDMAEHHDHCLHGAPSNESRFRFRFIMLIDCPHCYTRIVPMSDGCCPACRKNTRETTGADLSRTSIRVSQGDVLPPVCCDCGLVTSRVVSVYRKNTPSGEPPTSFGAAIFALFSLPLGLWLMLRGMANTTVAQTQMPQCDTCGTWGPPEPRYVDFGNATMTFIVHSNLKDAMAGAVTNEDTVSL